MKENSTLKLTKEEQKVLKSFKGNTVFLSYLDKVGDWICDVRNGNYTVETRNLVYKVIKEHLIDKIKLNSVINRPNDDFE